MVDFDFSSSHKPHLSDVVTKVGDISTLPQILRKILDVTSDPTAGAAELQDILKADPAITSKMLKLANSAYYSLPQKVLNIKRAVVLLGFKTVKNLAIATSVCDLFKSKGKINNYSREDLWKHSVVVAVCAKSIAQSTGLKIGEDIFTAGIMHDIGIIMEDQYFNADFIRVLENPSLEEVGLIEAERTVFGFDHSSFGEKIALQWKIPKEIAEIIASHHRPRLASENQRKPAAIIYLADVICTARKIGLCLNKKVNKTDFNFAMDTIDFKKEDISVIIDELPREIEKAKNLFML